MSKQTKTSSEETWHQGVKQKNYTGYYSHHSNLPNWVVYSFSIMLRQTTAEQDQKLWLKELLHNFTERKWSMLVSLSVSSVGNDMSNGAVLSPCMDGGAGRNRRGCPFELSPSLGNDVLRSALAPGDSWLSEHIPLAVIHAPLPSAHTHTHKCPDATLLSVPSLLRFSPCPLLPSSPPYSSASCDSTLNSSLASSLLVLICLFLYFPRDSSLAHCHTHSLASSFCLVGGALIQQLSQHFSVLSDCQIGYCI